MADSILDFISAGVLLGLSAGLSPGPLLTLVLTQTIKHNRTEGIKVAFSPLFTDFPIILVTLLVLNRISQFNLILAIISFAGGAFVAYLGIESLRFKGFTIDLHDSKSDSLKKGIIANFLNPSPYLFWATVGAPLILKAFQIDLLTTILFLISFYVFLVGSKVLIAFLSARTKLLMNQSKYALVMRILGIALLIFSIMFFFDGLKYLKMSSGSI